MHAQTRAHKHAHTHMHDRPHTCIQFYNTVRERVKKEVFKGTEGQGAHRSGSEGAALAVSVWLSVCVCVCVCLIVCMRVNVWLGVCMCLCGCVNVCVYVCRRMYVSTRSWLHMCTFVPSLSHVVMHYFLAPCLSCDTHTHTLF
jgi:cell division protein FtsW (lipid II flippase)